MRILVMFDLPVITDTDRREYRKFRKFLVLNGFLMLQESVYCKIAQNSVVADGIVAVSYTHLDVYKRQVWEYLGRES